VRCYIIVGIAFAQLIRRSQLPIVIIGPDASQSIIGSSGKMTSHGTPGNTHHLDGFPMPRASHGSWRSLILDIGPVTQLGYECHTCINKIIRDEIAEVPSNFNAGYVVVYYAGIFVGSFATTWCLKRVRLHSLCGMFRVTVIFLMSRVHHPN
jgi:hypothetical protein